jgi:LuxR family transcriptional regulator, maltose regulon positive regulatory protein
VQRPTLTVVGNANPLPRLDVQLLGSFLVLRDGQLIGVKSRKIDPARQLLALLVLNPNGLPDEQIAEQMWPEMTPERALHNLQVSAWALRKDLGARPAVRLYAKTYQLNPSMAIEADVQEFDEALARGRGATGEQLIQSLSRATELYKGALLADVGWHWVEPVRAEYRQRFVTAALSLADLVAQSDPARSDGLAERVIDVAPETDSAYERLIQNARSHGNALSVRRQVQRYQQAAARFGFNANPRLLSAGAGR